MVQKLGQSTIQQLVKLIFNGLMSVVTFADFYRSVMAFAAIFTYAATRVQLTILNTNSQKKNAKNASNQADNLVISR